jgi:hypothetical protein
MKTSKCAFFLSPGSVSRGDTGILGGKRNVGGSSSKEHYALDSFFVGQTILGMGVATSITFRYTFVFDHCKSSCDSLGPRVSSASFFFWERNGQYKIRHIICRDLLSAHEQRDGKETSEMEIVRVLSSRRQPMQSIIDGGSKRTDRSTLFRWARGRIYCWRATQPKVKLILHFDNGRNQYRDPPITVPDTHPSNRHPAWAHPTDEITTSDSKVCIRDMSCNDLC